VIERHETTRLVCPDELKRALPSVSDPAPDAVVTHNQAGGVWFDAQLARGAAAEAIVVDARAACAKAGAR
jgi:hypothetical protein